MTFDTRKTKRSPV